MRKQQQIFETTLAFLALFTMCKYNTKHNYLDGGRVEALDVGRDLLEDEGRDLLEPLPRLCLSLPGSIGVEPNIFSKRLTYFF